MHEADNHKRKPEKSRGKFAYVLSWENLRNSFKWTEFFSQSTLTSIVFLYFQIANNPCANLLTAHFRLDGHPNVNYLEKVIQNSAQSYLFFEPSQVAYNEWT